MARRVTRLAPSPTGALHLGNARTFLVNWALARQAGWSIVMRIEDLDGPRIKNDAAELALDTLRWLGIDWDGDPLTQSHDLSPYRRAMQTLAQQQRIFACDLSRSQISAAASAPHADEHEQYYAPHLRPADHAAFAFEREDCNYRFRVDDNAQVTFDDHCLGPYSYNVATSVGDFVIWTKRGLPAYQLAVVVDDARQGVTDVVRGDDLLSSAARQVLLQDALGLPRMHCWHQPLVLGPDGRRLAKRHGDTRVAAYRDRGVPATRIIGLLASWCGIAMRVNLKNCPPSTSAID
jgi:glutamyl-tRNA synthetase